MPWTYTTADMSIATRVGPEQSAQDHACATEAETEAAENTPFTAYPASFAPWDDGCLSSARSEDPSSGETEEQEEHPPTKRSCVEGRVSAAYVKEEVESCFRNMPGLSTKGIRSPFSKAAARAGRLSVRPLSDAPIRDVKAAAEGMRDLLAFHGRARFVSCLVNCMQSEDATTFLTEVRANMQVHAHAMPMHLFTCTVLAVCLASPMTCAGVTCSWCK
jgi:hypothetical protein